MWRPLDLQVHNTYNQYFYNSPYVCLFVVDVGRKMFENDSSLALSDARFLTEGSNIPSTTTFFNENLDLRLLRFSI